MKKSYTIEIVDPENLQELDITMRAMDLWIVMSDILEELRRKCKYDEGDVEKYEEVRSMFWNELSERGLGHLFI